MKPLVSIIIPNYNRANLIGETLNSVLMQTYENWEVIVVDDGSTDGSEKVVLKYAKQDERIKLLNRNRYPKGAPTCRNIGVEDAQGEYIIFLDSDDLLAPYCISNRIRQMQRNPEYDFLVFSMLTFKKYPGDSTILWNIDKEIDDLTCFLAGDPPWAITSPIWRFNSLKRVGKFNEDTITWQDWELHVRSLALQLKYKKIFDLPDCFVRRDDVNERISKKELHYKQLVSKFKLFNLIYKYLSERSVLLPVQKKGFALLLFRHSQEIAILIRERQDVKLFHELSKNFSKLILEYSLIPKHIAYLQLFYINCLLAIKVLRPYFLLKVIRSLLYRAFQKLLPGYLVKGKNTTLKYSINRELLEQLKLMNKSIISDSLPKLSR